jgi:squalene monooxygenase
MIQLHHLSPEIIVIGAGIAGTGLSHSLATSGRQVLLLERDLTEPDRIVGELLQPGGVAALTKLGLGQCLEGIDAVGVEGYCVVSGDRRVGVPYPALGGMVKDDDVVRIKGHAVDHVPDNLEEELDHWHVQSLSGKKEGRSFHHGRLIASLRNACSTTPNLTMLEATVKRLLYCDHTTRVIGVEASFKIASPNLDADADAEPITVTRKIYAPITIVADGYASKFRSQPGSRIPKPITKSSFVGVVVKDLDLPMPRHGTVCLTPAGPVLLYQIADEARETRMLVDVKGKLPSNGDGALQVCRLSRHVHTRY